MTTTPTPPRDPIGAATRHGATFRTLPTGWLAIAHRRGRKLALATFSGPTQAEAAELYCMYFHLKT